MENQKETVKKEDVLETENHIIAERLAKLDKLRAEGVAYPNDFVQKDRIEEVRAANGSKTPEEDRKSTRLNSSHMPKSRMPSSA